MQTQTKTLGQVQEGYDITAAPNGVADQWVHSFITEVVDVAPVGARDRRVEVHDNGKCYLMERISPTQWRLLKEVNDPRTAKN